MPSSLTVSQSDLYRDAIDEAGKDLRISNAPAEHARAMARL